MLATLLISAILEGIVISSPAHPNLDDTVQSNYRSVSYTQNNRTAYIEVQEGDSWRGVKLVFQHLDPEAKKLERYSHVTIDISEAVVEEDGKVVRDIPNGAVISVEPGSAADLPLLERSVNDITDADLYTWVTIPQCEFVFKDGSYCDILESYAYMMGTWQTLMTDRSGAPFYAVFNARVPWRRTGNGVPQGTGSVSGIVVKSDLLRYGKVSAPQIRVLEEEDFAISRDGNSSFTTICEWNWNDNVDEFRTTEGVMHYIKRQKVLPDEGKGYVWTDFEASTYRGRDLNNPLVEPDNGYTRGHRGQVLKGSMQVRTMAKNWWDWGNDCGNSLVIQFSTEGLSGDCLCLDFNFAAGDNSAYNTRMCPAYWGIEVSTDGDSFALLDIPPITLRPFPWWEKEIDGVHYVTSMECGLGLTAHQVRLPSSLLGQKNVYVRISPISRQAYSLALQGSDNWSLRPNHENWTFIEFGTISIRYR
ncbi:MAG: hypothetical protein J6X25_00715 [Bacteroidales bacterium]|nr:hypothetical protein [Bacteroidales bacterium]